MKIKTRIFSAFLIAGLTLTVLGVTLLYFTAEDDLTDEIYARLAISTNSLAKNISYILQEQEEDAGFFSKIPSNIELFRSSGDDSMNISTIKNSAKDIATGIVSSQNELIELDFIDTGGDIIASTDDEKTGTNRSDIFQEIILNGKFQNIAIPESRGSKPIYEYGIYIANPVGETIGAILLSIDLVSVYPLLEARTGLGISGETYLIDENGYIISPSKYKE
ncbi:cache domain-containing protein, partial [Patescibacteria group bacterium]|nr:cache domain-containing protein [Patescibacteria group bacterium]